MLWADNPLVLNQPIVKPQNEIAGMISRKRLGRQKELNFGYWNVLTLYRPGALQMLLNIIDEYKLDITAVQEMRWTGKGIIEKKKHTIYYSCDDKHHMLGTGFIARRGARSLVIGYKPVSPRICYLRIKGKFFNYSLFSVHSPTDVSEETEKDEFFELLERTVDTCPRADIRIIMGDFNSKIGRESVFFPTIGQHSLHHETNENGERLINFATSKDMIIGSTLFPHKRIHKGTWKSPDGNTVNQIDHILISARHRSDLINVRSYRGANVDSDHFLSIARIRAKIANARTRNERQNIKRYDVGKLKELGVREMYGGKLNERLMNLEIPGDSDINHKWNKYKEVIGMVAEEVLGLQGRQNRAPWFDDECRLVTAAKNESYKKMLQKKNTRAATEEYREKRRIEKKAHRKKKREWEDKELQEIEEHRNLNEVRKFYQKLNKGRKPFKAVITACKDETEALLTGKVDILCRWKRYFEGLLTENTENTGNSMMNEGQENQGEDDTLHTQTPDDELEPPDDEEILEAVMKLKNNKATGIDGLPAELFKYGENELIKILRDLFLRIWTEEKIPEEWNRSVICPIYKKGDILNCGNYRGISLLPCAYKILSNILFQRLLPLTERTIGKYQCGFRRGRSTTDQMFSLRMLLERTREFNVKTHHLFIDFKSAYDSINREQLYRVMIEMNIPPKLVRLVRMTMENADCVVRIQSDLSQSLKTNKGLRQGDALACLLFNLALEKAVRDSGIQTGGTLLNKTVQILAYADDIDIMARSMNALKEAFLSLEAAAGRLGLVINAEKTKYMRTGYSTASQEQHLRIGHYKFEIVDEFTYLGSLVTSDNQVKLEVRKRIVAANRSYFGLAKHLKSKLISRSTKTQLYKTLIRPVLCYGAEAWAMTKADERALSLFERKVLRRIYGPTQDGQGWRIKKNRELYALFQEPDIVRFTKISRLRWAGHVARMSLEDIPKKILLGSIEGSRKAGRPKQRWEDGVAKDARVLLGFQNWRAAAQNRDAWRTRLEEAKTLNEL